MPNDRPQLTQRQVAGLVYRETGHADHAGCAAALRDLSDAPVVIHRADAEMLRRGKHQR